jgi:hypothetical protein
MKLLGKKKHRLAELVEDLSVYPRQNLDDVHVRDLFLALEAGADLPTIVAEHQSLRVVDGWHRLRALQRKYGPEHEDEVEVVEYENEVELFLDAVRRNATHGRKLATADKIRAAVVLRRMGCDDTEELASALAMPIARVRVLSDRVVLGSGGQEIPLKV